jgi:addiction module HigA family antidote
MLEEQVRKHFPAAYILLHEYIEPFGWTVKEVADSILVDENVLQDFVDMRTELTVDLAIRLGKAFGNGAMAWLTIETHSKLRQNRHVYESINQMVVHETYSRR